MRYQSKPVDQAPISGGKDQVFQSLAQKFSAFNNERENELDREVMKKGQEQGLIDAQGKTEITLRDGGTIADEAWNKGAIASHMSAIKLDITENATRIAAESKRNPEVYKAKMGGYSKGLLSGVPESIRPVVQDELASIILKSGNAISADLVTYEREQQAATTGTAIDIYRAESENQAIEGDVLGATESQLKATQLVNSLEESGLITPAAAETQRNDILREADDSLVYGAFNRSMAQGDALKFIKKFSKMKSFNSYDLVTGKKKVSRDPGYRKKMSDKMIGMIKDSHTASDNQRKREDDERKARWRKGAQDVVTLDLEGALIIEHLQEMVKNDQLDPKVADKYKKNALLDGPEFSDQIVKNEITADLLSYSEFDISINPELSRPDRNKLISDRRALEEDKGNWKATQNGREGARRINQAFGIIKGVDTRISKEKAQRAGMVLTRYFNEIEALPLEEREQMTIEVSDRLVKEVNNEILVSDLEKAKDQLNDAAYQTEAQIKEADLGTEEEKIQIIQLNRKLKKIERLERQSGQ